MRPRRTLKNQPEEQCARWLESHGFFVSKRGWPDFVVFDSHGRIAAVEVKPHSARKLRRTQERILRALAAAGIPAFAWTPDRGLMHLSTGLGRGRGGFLPFLSDRSLAFFQ